jgi:hypothetical protein
MPDDVTPKPAFDWRPIASVLIAAVLSFLAARYGIVIPPSALPAPQQAQPLVVVVGTPNATLTPAGAVPAKE